MVKTWCHTKKDYKGTKHDRYPKMVQIDTIMSHLCCELGSLKNIQFLSDFLKEINIAKIFMAFPLEKW